MDSTIMLVKFLLPHTDNGAKEMVARFKRDGFVSFGIEDRHCGFIRRVGEDRGRILMWPRSPNQALPHG